MKPRLLEYLRQLKTAARQSIEFVDGMSYALRQALEDHNAPVKMVVYDGFGHPINKPKQQRAVMEENENWFNHYIWGDPLAPALTPTLKPAKPKPE